jgi:DNA-directed RNA polymerase specialized sigma24 family protein
MQNASAETEAEWNCMRLVLDEAILDLSTADREAILLCFFEGASFSVIGETLRVSERLRGNASTVHSTNCAMG